MDTSKLALEELFLWGCQTAQRRNGIERTSPKFIVEAGLVFGKKGRRVLGWRLRMKDGTVDFMRYKGNIDGEMFLKPVTKRRRRSKPRISKQITKGIEESVPLFSSSRTQ
jgi:hypothetical protein